MTSNPFALVSEYINATDSTKSNVHSRDLRVATVAPTQRRELLLSVEERDVESHDASEIPSSSSVKSDDQGARGRLRCRCAENGAAEGMRTRRPLVVAVKCSAIPAGGSAIPLRVAPPL